MQAHGAVHPSGTAYQQRADGHRGTDRPVRLYHGVEDGYQRGRGLAANRGQRLCQALCRRPAKTLQNRCRLFQPDEENQGVENRITPLYN